MSETSGSAALDALYQGDRARAESALGDDDALTVFEAAAFGRVQRLEALVDEDPELARALSPDGFTPLHLAVFGHSVEAVELLLERGADVERPSEHPTIRGVRPLRTAAFVRDAAAARLLLEHGAEANAPHENGVRALHVAAANGDAALVQTLLEYGADPSLAADDGRTPADVAREHGHDELATLLLARVG